MEKILQELNSIQGTNTNLVTFTISGNNNYTLSVQKINSEIATACNIKSRV